MTKYLVNYLSRLPSGTATSAVSSGDNFLSGPELSVSLGDDSPFYDALDLNLTGYDALTIGNHEFDLGPDLLARFITETTTAPFISANLDFSGEPALGAELTGVDAIVAGGSIAATLFLAGLLLASLSRRSKRLTI